MKLFLKFLQIALLAFCFLTQACSQNDSPQTGMPGGSIKDTYEQNISLPSRSVFSGKIIGTRSISAAFGVIPSVSLADLTLLKSRTLSELTNEISNLKALIGEERLNLFSTKQAENYANLFYTLGGHTGIDMLKNFALSYMKTLGGWSDIQELLPLNLSEDQTLAYIAIAIYIDRIGRPVYSILSQNASTRGSDPTPGDSIFFPPHPDPEWYSCRDELADSLVGLGLTIDVDKFIAIRKGNYISTEPEDPEEADPEISLALDEIWALYLTCIAHHPG